VRSEPLAIENRKIYYAVNKPINKEVSQMVGLESSMEQAETALKTKPKVDKAENERLKKFNEELRSRKAPQPKA
jgi:hypothetical protein